MNRALDADELQSEFDAHARRYDLLVGANLGYHRDLRRAAARLGLREQGGGQRVLDLGCGTGASTAAILAAYPLATVVGADASGGMLAAARGKPWPGSVTFVQARAERLAAAGVRGPFDAIFAGYLLRNVADPDAVLADLRTLLRPGGHLVLHDYTLDGRPLSRAVWTAVCWGVIIPAGLLATGRTGLYRYLWRSVLDFDRVGALRERLRDNGFTEVRAGSAGGWQRGVTHTVRGRRQLDGGTA
ncbi:class I SAM-dependent methyltransferase [Crossiella cryophila]|uniref:Ubiquinone/menaquinone biosynthesis C-methylase UbiE n=1 Tax=Crossiella cryophila TaxID=43355 RepID=A0A7W7CBC4_9PSEU|nr:class I SAM-dependent methyltransferase [Crossiella cryophila]MBB4678012.1 ubiquinone/menaquinone biosynthesis C-methylase UbiE [Crossiella cryophila]